MHSSARALAGSLCLAVFGLLVGCAGLLSLQGRSESHAIEPDGSTPLGQRPHAAGPGQPRQERRRGDRRRPTRVRHPAAPGAQRRALDRHPDLHLVRRLPRKTSRSSRKRDGSSACWCAAQPGCRASGCCSGAPAGAAARRRGHERAGDGGRQLGAMARAQRLHQDVAADPPLPRRVLCARPGVGHTLARSHRCRRHLDPAAASRALASRGLAALAVPLDPDRLHAGVQVERRRLGIGRRGPPQHRPLCEGRAAGRSLARGAPALRSALDRRRLLQPASAFGSR